jgi:hypothetical protein
MTEPAAEFKPVYRVDKFVVPPPARDEFLDRVRATHRILREQPGFVRDHILEQSDGPGSFNIVTLVEWAGQEYIDSAKIAVMAAQRKMNFNPQELLARLGIKADIANYQRLEA